MLGEATLSEVHSSLTRGGSSQGLSLLPQFYLIIWIGIFNYLLLSDLQVKFLTLCKFKVGAIVGKVTIVSYAIWHFPTWFSFEDLLCIRVFSK